MRFKAACVAGLLSLFAIDPSYAVVRIANDRGGQIGRYLYRYDKLRASRQPVMIDGLCASACTIVLAEIPADRICVTSQATLAFHAAWDIGRQGLPVMNPGATRMLYSWYPAPVQRWIDGRGGLTSRLILLRGKRLQSMYRTC
jgi:hypothetical protein